MSLMDLVLRELLLQYSVNQTSENFYFDVYENQSDNCISSVITFLLVNRRGKRRRFSPVESGTECQPVPFSTESKVSFHTKAS